MLPADALNWVRWPLKAYIRRDSAIGRMPVDVNRTSGAAGSRGTGASMSGLGTAPMSVGGRGAVVSATTSSRPANMDIVRTRVLRSGSPVLSRNSSTPDIPATGDWAAARFADPLTRPTAHTVSTTTVHLVQEAKSMTPLDSNCLRQGTTTVSPGLSSTFCSRRRPLATSP